MSSSEIFTLDKNIELWKNNADMIREFLNCQPSYKHLSSEVAYTIEKRLKDNNLKYAAVTYRNKEVGSFLNKISRKKYTNPLSEITDIAGVRVVYLYLSDYKKIEKIIEEEFVVTERIDKLAEQGDQKFGYGAVHFVVKLGEKTSGARYDDLKTLKCEIQVRTVLQDAWSIIYHHLIYKKEKDVPGYIKRKINSLSGLFETADDQFDRIKFEREKYIKEIENSLTTKGANLSDKINIDNIVAYLEWKFPNIQTEGSAGHASNIVGQMNTDKYQTIEDIESLINRTEKARVSFKRYEPIQYSVGELAIALGFDDPSFRAFGWDPKDIELFEKFQKLVMKN